MAGSRRRATPRRSGSVESYLRETRLAALVAMLLLAAGIASDVMGGDFWERHGLLAGLAGSLIVVALSAAVFNEVVQRRSRRRWSVLAQYVMIELTRNARMFWTSVAEAAGLMPSGPRTADVLEGGSKALEDTPRLRAALQGLIADGDHRRVLQAGVARFVDASDELLGRWAGVMLSSDAYAEIIDRHVELSFEVAWLESLLEAVDPSAEMTPAVRQMRSHPALQIEGPVDEERLANRLVMITRLAEQLDELTLDVAGKIVPVDWWAGRLDVAPTLLREKAGE